MSVLRRSCLTCVRLQHRRIEHSLHQLTQRLVFFFVLTLWLLVLVEHALSFLSDSKLLRAHDHLFADPGHRTGSETLRASWLDRWVVVDRLSKEWSSDR